MTSEEHEDLEIYNKQGEFLQEFYKLNDFLSNAFLFLKTPTRFELVSSGLQPDTYPLGHSVISLIKLLQLKQLSTILIYVPCSIV